MRCIRPLTSSFDEAGNRVYNIKHASKELVPLTFACRKCLPCRLNLGREKAIRCWHESQMHKNNIFLTLTYDDKKCRPEKKLQYQHFQTFMKDLRDHVGYQPEDRISMMVTGEYGDKNKRPHWHALIFNYSPPDGVKSRTTELEHEVFNSNLLNEIWGRGITEFGSLTLESASYVARYSAKKLIHGRDQDHDFHPIHKTSSRRAIGRTWIEKNFEHTFRNGFIVLPNGQEAAIPRYYKDWLKKHNPSEYLRYVTEVQPRMQHLAEYQQQKEEHDYLTNRNESPFAEKRSTVKQTILKLKFDRLQENLKL